MNCDYKKYTCDECVLALAPFSKRPKRFRGCIYILIRKLGITTERKNRCLQLQERLMNQGEDIGLRHRVSLVLHSHGMKPIFVLTSELYKPVDNSVNNSFTT